MVLDARGGLQLAVQLDATALPPALHRQVQFHRLAGTPRSLDVNSLHLFAFDRLSRGPDVPGLNDPVILHGTLHGPFPSGAPSTCAGVLTVTRAELLDAFVRGLGWAMRSAAGGDSGATGRWLHLHLPAAEEADLDVGAGTVLAFALGPVLAGLPEEGNVELTLELLQEVLETTRRDPAARGLPVSAARVPTASREAVEVALEAQGFAIEGEVAVRDGPGLLGSLVPRRVPLPRQGTLADFAESASRALSAMTDWPTARARSAQQRVRADRAAWVAGEPQGLVPVETPATGRFERHEESLISRPAGTRWSLDRETRLKATWRTVGFRVDPAFATWNSGRMDLEVEFLAEAAGDLAGDWEHHGTPYPAEGAVGFEASEEFRSARLTFGNAIFIGGFPGGAGFRLCLRSPGAVRLRKVSLRPLAPLPRVVPRPFAPPPADEALAGLGVRIESRAIRHQVGCAYIVAGPFGEPGDDGEAPRRSSLTLFENGAPLGPAHSGHHLVREQGLGHYSHWGDSLVFSTSDNTDPRANGRVYTWRR